MLGRIKTITGTATPLPTMDYTQGNCMKESPVLWYRGHPKTCQTHLQESEPHRRCATFKQLGSFPGWESAARMATFIPDTPDRNL